MPRLRATLGIAGLLALLLMAAWPQQAVCQDADAAAAWRQMFKRPSTPPPSPADNPLTADKVALGARLFSEVRLSGGGDRSCASCHDPDRAFDGAACPLRGEEPQGHAYQSRDAAVPGAWRVEGLRLARRAPGKRARQVGGAVALVFCGLEAPHAWAHRDGWIPGTSPGMTAELAFLERDTDRMG